MRVPRVDALVYKMKVRDSVQFVNAPPLEHVTPRFRTRLADGELRIELLDHHADVQSAKEAVASFLDAWEMDSALAAHRRDFWFQFERAEATGLSLSGLASVTTSARGTLTVLRSAYPPPPRSFLVTNLVRQLWDRYEAAIDDREPATSAGYYCFTTLVALAPNGTRKAQRPPWAARSLAIEESVLITLNKLTNKGDPTTARKYSSTPVPHTGAELNWLRMAVRVLTRRLGEWEADRDATLPMITMSDLPPL